MYPKFMTSHLFDCKNVTEGNMIPKKKMVSYDLGHSG